MKKKVKVIITGSNGVVGSYISSIFDEDNYNLRLTTHSDLDVANKNNVFGIFRSFKPNLVIHLAAETDVDLCERKPTDAFRVNTEGTGNIVSACLIHNSTLIFTSTAGLFNGSKRGFYEEDYPSPLNNYAKSKFMAERLIQNLLKKYYIVRAGWMIGGGKKEKKFISYVLNKIKKNEKINAVNDLYGTITYAKELVSFIKSLHENKNEYGIYHFGSSGVASRYDIAREVAKVLKSSAEIIPVSSEEFSDRFFAPRPKNEILKSRKIIFLNSWKKSLADYINHEII